MTEICLEAFIHRIVIGVFSEDKEILEAQQRSIAANPDMKLNAYSIDQGGVRARRVIANAIRKQDETVQ